MDTDLTNTFSSHRDKPLEIHLSGVARKVLRRTQGLPTNLNLKRAEIAALFHDLGKINPYFQEKLKNIKPQGYSGHSYLSAYALFCFALSNREKVNEWCGNTTEGYLSLLAMIARHHGDLPNFRDRIFKRRPFDELQQFLSEKRQLPISDFLQILLPHASFEIMESPQFGESVFNAASLTAEQASNPLAFFLETQFGFACLLEADKRDAGDNEEYKRERLNPYFQKTFGANVDKKLNSYKAENELDRARTRMRQEAVANLRSELNEDKRIFTLSAPTGAGKTMMLLALAKEILAHNPSHSVIYALPFLSITEQVEAVCKEVLNDLDEFDDGRLKDEVAVLRVDSRAENPRIEKLQSELEKDQTEEKLSELLSENFSAETFDHPFIVTTFVQVFETLVSNRNATLLRLPNFSRSIFLLDEIQALPPRLYIFFVALLDEFCRQFDGYAIVSTATMPYLELRPKEHVSNKPDCEKPEKLFENYKRPPELLSADCYKEKVFNRYRINNEQHISTIEQLAYEIQKRDSSCLVILNIIDDTKRLYARLRKYYSIDECVLLNAHFTLNDRREKLSHCQQRLDENEKIILVSTQLIEAGVDIDFPELYRDWCPLPNLIQSAGRCNRNGKYPDGGEVHFIALRNAGGKLSAELIYRGKDKKLLDFGSEKFPPQISEDEMKVIQERYFEFIGTDLSVGEHEQTNINLHLIKQINKAEFDTLGKFKLIDDQDFGAEYRYFIPQGFVDTRFKELEQLVSIKSGRGFAEAKKKRIAIETKLREMADDIVQFRLPKGKSAPSYVADEILGIRKLADIEDYSSELGIALVVGGCII
jgi:CRISPR-associated endonuclease/helicase Cas3